MMMHIGITVDRGECEGSCQRSIEGPLPGAELVVGVGGVSGGDHGAGGEGPEEGDHPRGGTHMDEIAVIGIFQKMTEESMLESMLGMNCD